MGRMDYFIVVSKFQDTHIYIYYILHGVYILYAFTHRHTRTQHMHARTDRQTDRQTDTDTDTGTDMSIIETKIQTYKMKWKQIA